MILGLAMAWAAPVELRVFEHGSGNGLGAVVTLDGRVLRTDRRGHLTVDLTEMREASVSAPGHGTALVELVPGRRHRVFLRTERGPLVVVVEAFDPSADVSKHTVDGEVAYETPGNLEDAVRLVQSLPGVAVQREYSPSAGTLSVRGSAPHDSRYYLDGIEVPYLYHFNQYASVFPVSQLGQLELYSSTFGSRFGDSVGAIVEAETSRARPEGVDGSAFLNFVIVGGQVRAPLGGKWWMAASGRRSYQDLVGEQTDQYTVWPVFSDYALRLEHGDADRGTGLFFWGAGDSYTRAAGELDVLDPVEAENTPQFAYGQNFKVGGLRHHWATPDDWGRFVIGVVDHDLEGSLASGGDQRQHTTTLTSRLDASHRFGPRSGWDLGYELQSERTQLAVVDPGFGRVLVAEEAPALARGEPVDDSMSRTMGGLYGTWHTGVGGLRVMPALRLGFDSSTSNATWEPRVTTRLRLTDTTEVRAAAGRYTQRPPTPHLFAGTGDPNFPTTTSWQVAAGIEQTVGGRLTLNLEGYQKWLSDVLVFPIDGPGMVEPSAMASGAELTWRYRLKELLFLHGWASVSRSRITGPRARPADGDQPVNLGLVFSWDPSDRWNLGVRYRLGSGLPFTPIDGSVYDGGRDAWIPLPGSDNSERFPVFQKVDLRIAWTVPFNRWSLTTSAELWYVPKSSAQLYPAWNFDYTQTDWVRGPTLLPLLGMRAKF